MTFLSKIALTAALSAITFSGAALAQYKVAPGKYAVKFTDKAGNGFSISKPEQFLSQKAIDRRAKWGIGISEIDLPVTSKYVDSLKAMGFRIHCISKWHNCCVVACGEEMLPALDGLSFVDTRYQWRRTGDKSAKQKKVKRPKIQGAALPDRHVFNYGEGDNQAKMLNIHKLHGQGFTGKGITIAILDAGFYKANQLSSLKPLFSEGRVLGTRDFVDGDTSVYDSDNHGMNVLSCIAAKQDGRLVGTAPDASVWLFRTEDSETENIIEEFNFAAGAELADSLGVDMLHASLGYQDFDDNSVDYTRQENDGNTTIAAVACDIAASRGIVITISAGNGGDDLDFPWATSPSDADSVLAVGAVDKNGDIAYFSSKGPTYDGRVKPDVCALGVYAAVQGASDRITRSSGTSFAGPIIAGCVMCLIQAHPNASVFDVLQAVRASGLSWKKPSEEYGYGIPDFEIAHKILLKKKL